jgi:hypothetical protein
VTTSSPIRPDPTKDKRSKWEWTGAAAVTGSFVVAEVVWSGPTLLPAVGDATRGDLYISLAASAAALLGFSITAGSILLSLGTGPRIDWLRDQAEFQQTRHIFMRAIRALAMATIVFTALILADAGRTGTLWLELPGVLLGVLVLIRLERVIWLLDQLLRISIQDRMDKTLPNPPFSEPLDG